ncbi:MAG TPA: GatB/YqeY domain-containing protein [Candidatus Margulisiibacteriota bacterium]|nr:GatB/YqeY domain-containing protein [Candidatus Margulisiibacteriota bacterium]
MATEAQLQDDLQAAMKARAMEKVYILRGLITAIKNLKVEKQLREVPEADIAVLVRKEINKRSEAVEFARQAGRQELVDQNERERAMLEAYLPPQLSARALEDVIKGLAAELGTTQIGPLMAKLRERYVGQFDGKLASELIRKLA